MKTAFNIDEVIQAMLGAAKNQIKKDWKGVAQTAKDFMERRKARLVNLAEDRISRQITDADLKSFLEDEQLLFKSELDALALIAKSVAQKAANAALDVLYAAINKLIPLSAVKTKSSGK